LYSSICSLCKGRNRSNTKPPSLCRRNRMLRALNHRQDITNHALIQIDLNTDLLDKVILTKVVPQPTGKPRSVGPHKLIPKKIDKKKKACLENKKLRSANESLYGIHVDPANDNNNVPQQRLLFTNKDKRNYPFINNDTYIPIVTWKITKNQSNIISDISTPGRLPHSGFSQSFVLNASSSSVSEKDICVLYHLIARLLFSSKITRQDVLTCVSYTIIRMELSTDYHEGGPMNIDVLFVKKNLIIVHGKPMCGI